MREPRPTAGLIPPSIADERGKAFGRVMERAVSDPDFKRLLFERIDTVEAAMLPFLVREFSVEEFVEPGMSEAVVRRLLKASYDLHASKGFISGVRKGLLLLGMRTAWKQWFQQVPVAEPGTHVATVFVNETVFDDQDYMLDERVQRAALRMIAGMKRHSQHVAFQIGVSISSRVTVASAGQALQVGEVQANAVTPRRGRSRLTAACASQALQIAVVDGEAYTPRRGRAPLKAALASLQMQFGQYGGFAKHRSMR